MSKPIRTFYKRTKIISTLGPSITQKLFTFKAFNDPKNVNLKKLAYKNVEDIIRAGVNCLRLNFSHGDYEEHQIRIQIVREVAKKLNRNIALMLDTKGPEIRVNKLKDEKIEIKTNTIVKIHTIDNMVGNANEFSVSDSTGKYNMANDVKEGSLILIDDGKLELKVNEVFPTKGIINATAINTHTICSKKRINLPGAAYSLPFLSDKDKEDILFACKNDFDYIASSFTNSAKDVNDIRDILVHNNKSNIQIIAKIETGLGLNNLDEIIEASDGIMVARGDLALEIPYYEVPYWQKQMIRKCRYVGKPCIVATQMLDSLERVLQPTRAEVTDVFFAVERGADTTMLSGETANGLYPINAVQTMNNIDVASELLFDYDRAINFYFKKTTFPHNIKKIAKKIAHTLEPKGEQIDPKFPYDFCVIFTDDKLLIRTLSNIRPGATMLVVTSERELLNAFAISYAIQTYYVPDLNEAKLNYKEVADEAVRTLVKHVEARELIAYFDKKFHEI